MSTIGLVLPYVSPYIKKLFSFKDISRGLLLGKDLVYGTNFADSKEERADLLKPQSKEQAKPFGQVNQSAIVDEFLGKKTNGFFIGTIHI